MMNIPPSYSERRKLRRRKQRQRNKLMAPTSSAIFPDELMAEILSFLDVKSLLKIRCVSKSLKSLISDPIFVRLHLKRSKRNPQFAIYLEEHYLGGHNGNASVVPIPISRLLENPLITLPTDPCYHLKDKDCQHMVGSCNGLICLIGSLHHTFDYKATWFCFWNPATREVSQKLGYFRDYSCRDTNSISFYDYMFGYDDSTRTYKLVALHLVGKRLNGKPQMRTDVKVLSLGDNVWRNIQSLPLIPYPYVPDAGYGVDFRGSLNWLSLPNYIDTIQFEKFVITSFDLSTETCMQFLPPLSFDGSSYIVPDGLSCIVPHISVLVDCLCFSYDVERTHLVTWKMTEFGVQESWTQFLKISYQNLYIGSDFCDWKKNFNCRLKPLHLFENSDTLIFSKLDATSIFSTLIFYNWRGNTVKKPRITQQTWQWCFSQNYVESLVSPC